MIAFRGVYSLSNLSDKSLLPLRSSLGPNNQTARSALIQWTRSAAQHDVDALVKVGDYYYHGVGVEKEPQEMLWEKAAGYYLSAVETQRSALAMWNLGWMYESGRGVSMVRIFESNSVRNMTQSRL